MARIWWGRVRQGVPTWSGRARLSGPPGHSGSCLTTCQPLPPFLTAYLSWTSDLTSSRICYNRYWHVGVSVSTDTKKISGGPCTSPLPIAFRNSWIPHHRSASSPPAARGGRAGSVGRGRHLGAERAGGGRNLEAEEPIQVAAARVTQTDRDSNMPCRGSRTSSARLRHADLSGSRATS